MPQIWMDDENGGAQMLPRSARKTTADSGKKSVLGKLDNVLYNKTHLTPFNGDRAKWAPKMSLCRETLQKQHRRQQSKHNAPQSHGGHTGLDMFDFMDFPSKKCLKNCQKPISQSRLEPLLSDDLIAKLLSDSVEADEEMPYEIPVYPDIDADAFAEKPMERRIYETEDNFSGDIFEAKLPPIIYDTDLEQYY